MTQRDGINYSEVVKGEEHFIFIFRDRDLDALLEMLLRLMENKDWAVNFTACDALLVTSELKVMYRELLK